MKNRNFNFQLIGLNAKDKSVLSVNSDNYPWEFKTVIYDCNDFRSLRTTSILLDEKNVTRKLLIEAKEPIFLNFVPIKNKKGGQFKVQAIGISEKSKIIDLIKDDKVNIMIYSEFVENYSLDDFFCTYMIRDNGDNYFRIYMFNNRYCRVTYVLDKEFNIWLPCFVTYSQANGVIVFKPPSNGNGYAITNFSSSNSFVDTLIEKETNNKYKLPVVTKANKIFESIQDQDKSLKNKIYESTDIEKEMAKKTFIKYSGRKTMWDENSNGNKYITWVDNGRRILSVENKTPSFPILNYNKESHLIGVVVFSFGILFILFSIGFFYMSFKNRNK